MLDASKLWVGIIPQPKDKLGKGSLFDKMFDFLQQEQEVEETSYKTIFCFIRIFFICTKIITLTFLLIHTLRPTRTILFISSLIESTRFKWGLKLGVLGVDGLDFNCAPSAATDHMSHIISLDYSPYSSRSSFCLEPTPTFSLAVISDY